MEVRELTPELAKQILETAATMNVHGVKNLLTFNTDDFKRYSDIAAIDPRLKV
jgi:hypothetical protein